MAAFVMAPAESTWKAMLVCGVMLANDEEPTMLDVPAT